jgi:hypothetical protein
MEEESEDIMVIVRRIFSLIITIPEGTTVGIISVTITKRRKRKIIVDQHTREDRRKRRIDPEKRSNKSGVPLCV